MGRTLKSLAKSEIGQKSIFNNRFCVEICEKVHFHYRNLRINLSQDDFMEMCTGMIAAMERWTKRGRPQPQEGTHIELCRRKVAQNAYSDGIQVNYNANLYKKNEGKIFSEGSELEDGEYIHLKIRDLRIELTKEEFNSLAESIRTAQEQLKDINNDSGVQEAGIHEEVYS